MPQFAQNFCAYHTNQQLTNFCTCTQCLLPVCPTCIKVHSQQHSQKGSHPQFQKLGNVFNEVYQSCSNIVQGLSRLKEELLEVEKVKKENEGLILQKIKLYRNKLIREFQRVLMDLEYEMVKKFQQQDEKFIMQIQKIDINIDRIESDVSAQLMALEGQDGLRTVIFHLSKNYQIECLKSINGLNQRIKQMLKRNVYLEVQQDKVDEIKQSVMSYLKLGVIEWGLQKDKQHIDAIKNTQNTQNQWIGTRQNSFEGKRQMITIKNENENEEKQNYSRRRVLNQ